MGKAHKLCDSEGSVPSSETFRFYIRGATGMKQLREVVIAGGDNLKDEESSYLSDISIRTIFASVLY
jgi:hypothetical protein